MIRRIRRWLSGSAGFYCCSCVCGCHINDDNLRCQSCGRVHACHGTLQHAA